MARIQQNFLENDVENCQILLKILILLFGKRCSRTLPDGQDLTGNWSFSNGPPNWSDVRSLRNRNFPIEEDCAPLPVSIGVREGQINFY